MKPLVIPKIAQADFIGKSILDDLPLLRVTVKLPLEERKQKGLFHL